GEARKNVEAANDNLWQEKTRRSDKEVWSKVQDYYLPEWGEIFESVRGRKPLNKEELYHFMTIGNTPVNQLVLAFTGAEELGKRNINSQIATSDGLATIITNFKLRNGQDKVVPYDYLKTPTIVKETPAIPEQRQFQAEPVYIGPNTYYDVNTYSTGGSENPYAGPSYALSYADINSGPELAAGLYYNTASPVEMWKEQITAQGQDSQKFEPGLEEMGKLYEKDLNQVQDLSVSKYAYVDGETETYLLTRLPIWRAKAGYDLDTKSLAPTARFGRTQDYLYDQNEIINKVKGAAADNPELASSLKDARVSSYKGQGLINTSDFDAYSNPVYEANITPKIADKTGLGLESQFEKAVKVEGRLGDDDDYGVPVAETREDAVTRIFPANTPNTLPTVSVPSPSEDARKAAQGATLHRGGLQNVIPGNGVMPIGEYDVYGTSDKLDSKIKK
ncbi:MAG: hypothetical protein PHF11_00885, partial [Candidatus Omnitrophica bacterium]|nr:hypothetical protein [Candidatus Omnitrophota bacterium]